jgi:hypothetical protein
MAKNPDRPSHLSQLDTPAAAVPADEGSFRILFIGDSITRHGTNPEVAASLGWDHVAGMAASSEALDYVHLFAAQVEAGLSGRKVAIHFHTYGGGGTVAQRLGAVGQVRDVKPDLVVVQLGEHEKREAGTQTLRVDYEKLITAFDTQQPRPLVLCVGPWSPPENGLSGYAGWPGEVQRVMREVCAHRRIPFISIQEAGDDPACSGTGTSAGVRWHPNDRGHFEYARRLWLLFREAAAL